MIRTFIEVPIFCRNLKDLGLTDEELKTLKGVLLENPAAEKVMQGTGGVRKIRLQCKAIKEKAPDFECATWILKNMELPTFLLFIRRKIKTL